ncbi:MAG: hypothetical protein HKN91_11935 [Acidimicrobiia bacterium]|nr:hypothetical protein [Acidimicrobiia bacterium]
MGDTFQGPGASDPTAVIRRHLLGEDGQARVEYGFVIAVLATVAILMLTIMDRSVQDIADAIRLLF